MKHILHSTYYVLSYANTHRNATQHRVTQEHISWHDTLIRHDSIQSDLTYYPFNVINCRASCRTMAVDSRVYLSIATYSIMHYTLLYDGMTHWSDMVRHCVM